MSGVLLRAHLGLLVHLVLQELLLEVELVTLPLPLTMLNWLEPLSSSHGYHLSYNMVLLVSPVAQDSQVLLALRDHQDSPQPRCMEQEDKVTA